MGTKVTQSNLCFLFLGYILFSSFIYQNTGYAKKENN
jgi:hypothetical protein